MPDEEWPGAAAHWLFVVLAMPVPLAVLALRSWTRIVELMTGSAYTSLGRACHHDQSSWGVGLVKNCGWSFQNVTKLEFHTSETDLDAAMACQYAAVFCFALLCIHYFPKYPFIHEANADYIYALKTVGFLGL